MDETRKLSMAVFFFCLPNSLVIFQFFPRVYFLPSHITHMSWKNSAVDTFMQRRHHRVDRWPRTKSLKVFARKKCKKSVPISTETTEGSSWRMDGKHVENQMENLIPHIRNAIVNHRSHKLLRFSPCTYLSHLSAFLADFDRYRFSHRSFHFSPAAYACACVCERVREFSELFFLFSLWAH